MRTAEVLVEVGVLRTQTYQEPGSRPRQSCHLTEAGRDLQLVRPRSSSGATATPAPQAPPPPGGCAPPTGPVHVGILDDDGHEVPGTGVVILRDTGAKA
ncbi:hypothetical protein [Streptomyces sp. NPDC059909]|uniref:hypothetical protein n=1 Tax=Streptomyces sp. NPDC059909 TaxID=3346998 RepID=UPI0036588B27